MPKITTNEQGHVDLAGALTRPSLASPGTEYWLEERDGSLTLHPRRRDLRKLYLEPTTGCNLQCRTCIRNAWHEGESFMSEATFQRIVDSLDRFPDLARVIFTGFGEPLYHPRLLDMIAAIRQRDLAVTVGTNGTLLDRRMATEFIRLGVDRVIVSVDGVRPATYADIRGTAIAEVLDNIRHLNEEKSKAGSLTPILALEFVALRSNVAELPDLAGLASHLGAARVLVSNVLAYTEATRGQMLYGYSPTSPLSPGAWPLRADIWVMWGTLDLPRMHWGAERRCRFVNDRASVIGWDGAVLPCYALAHDYRYFAIDGVEKEVTRYRLGNVEQTPLADIWTSEEYVRFRAEVRAFHFPSCPDCDLRDTCDLRQRNEACWGWTPSCADCLWAQDIVRCP